MQGLEVLKPVVTALLLPPVPMLLLILLGLRWTTRRPRLGRAAIVASVVLIWLGCCVAPSRWLHRQLGLDVPALDATRLESMQSDGEAKHTTILVLGGGMVASPDAPGRGELNSYSFERLRTGIRLAHVTGWPLAFAGGRGWAQAPGIDDSEAAVAQRTVERDFGMTLAWIEPDSRDTAENATHSVALLRSHGTKRVVLVSDAAHLPRARALFERAGGADLQVVLAPVPGDGAEQAPWLQWLPSSRGFEETRNGLREKLGQAFMHLASSFERDEAAP